MTAVRLIGITQPTIEGVKDANELVAYAARVSNPSNQMNTETAPKLVSYLIRNQHWSPFEMVSLTMEIKTTRDISRQILRHRSFSFQEFSQRYAISEKFSFREARLQDTKNRQNSVEIDRQDEKQRRVAEDFNMNQVALAAYARKLYEAAIESGIAKEQARVLLPEGLTETTLYMAGTLRSWLHYVALRAGNGTQKEHREIAIQALDVILEHFPSLADTLKEMALADRIK